MKQTTFTDYEFPTAEDLAGYDSIQQERVDAIGALRKDLQIVIDFLGDKSPIKARQIDDILNRYWCFGFEYAISWDILIPMVAIIRTKKVSATYFKILLDYISTGSKEAAFSMIVKMVERAGK